MRKPEIMSPAGYWPQLHAAVGAGADAVYFGLHRFSARAKVGFEMEELPEVMATLRARGVRGYLTLNTLIFEREIQAAAETIEAVAHAGVDALIVQDVGIARLAHRIAPSLELHASTQMSVTSADGVRLAQSFGAARVTLARELSIEEIAAIYRETGCDLEIFVHGALCVAYSGQCFSSEAWGGRSANRGQCAQACRLPYEMIVDGVVEPLADARYLLSPGDLYALRQVPEIVAAGVAALKIEGRYKDADYVALTTQAYRRAVDEAYLKQSWVPSRVEELRLEQVYSRGLGPHFLTGTNHQAVVQGRAPRHRGVLMGKVARVEGERVWMDAGAAHLVAPLKAGDGVVFDAADWRSPGEPEEGGRVYEVLAGLELRFGNGAIRFSRIRKGDLVWRTDDPSLERAVREIPVARQAVRVRVAVAEKLTATWTLVKHPEISVTVEAPAAAAANRALDAAYLAEQFGRLGNTAYELAGLEAEFSRAAFLPASVLNGLRREAVAALAARQVPVAHETRRVALEVPAARVAVDEPQLHLLVRTPEQLEAALGARPASITLDYLDLYGLRPSIERVKASGIAARVASPRVLKPGEGRIADFLVSLGCAILVRPAGLLPVLRGRAELVGDFSLNTANTLSAAAYLEFGLKRVTPTYDLDAAQVEALARVVDVEAVAYQHLPVFHTEHCVFCRFLSTGTSYKDCGRPCEEHRVALRDQNGRAHPVMADVGCRNTVFGAEAQEASGFMAAWLAAGVRHFRLEFVHESGEQVRAVTEVFGAGLRGRAGWAEVGRKLKSVAPEGTTEGSLFVPRELVQIG